MNQKILATSLKLATCFPSESQGLNGEKNAGLGHGQVYWFEYGMSMYMIERSKCSSSSIFRAALKGKTEVFLKPDAASELTNAASRLCWKISPSIARTLQSCD